MNVDRIKKGVKLPRFCSEMRLVYCHCVVSIHYVLFEFHTLLEQVRCIEWMVARC